jgi:hypothetical protein
MDLNPGINHKANDEYDYTYSSKYCHTQSVYTIYTHVKGALYPMKPAQFRGIKVHDTEKDTWDLNKAADLPENPRNVPQAAAADPDAPAEGPDIRNQLRKYGVNINQIPKGGPAYGS